jgi:hypothetical protein
LGGSAMLELKMRGYPRPQIKWLKDGVPLKLDETDGGAKPRQEELSHVSPRKKANRSRSN